MVFLEGVYEDRTAQGLPPRFRPQEPPTDAEIAAVLQKISQRVIRQLRTWGYLEAGTQDVVPMDKNSKRPFEPRAAACLAGDLRRRAACRAPERRRWAQAPGWIGTPNALLYPAPPFDKPVTSVGELRAARQREDAGRKAPGHGSAPQPVRNVAITDFALGDPLRRRKEANSPKYLVESDGYHLATVGDPLGVPATPTVHIRLVDATDSIRGQCHSSLR